MSDVHKEATPVYCSHCEKGFSRIVSLERHISEVHKKTTHRCPKCNMFLTREETLDRHISDVHKKEKNWECEHCPEDYSRWENLKRHLARGSHTFFIEGGCPHCKEDPSFKSKSAMNAHFIRYKNIHNSWRNRILYSDCDCKPSQSSPYFRDHDLTTIYNICVSLKFESTWQLGHGASGCLL